MNRLDQLLSNDYGNNQQTQTTDNNIANLGVIKAERMPTLEDKLVQKQQRLNTAIQEKTYMLESQVDGDTSGLVGQTYLDKNGYTKGNTRELYYDSYETLHPGLLDMPGEQGQAARNRLARQRIRYSAEFQKPLNEVTNEDIYEQGAKDTIQALYQKVRNTEDPKTFDVGPTDYYRTHEIELGSKENPINYPVNVKQYGTDAYGRHLTETFNKNTGDSVNARMMRPNNVALYNEKGYFDKEASNAKSKELESIYGAKKNVLESQTAGDMIRNSAQAVVNVGSNFVLGAADTVGELTGLYDLGSEEQLNKISNDFSGYDPRYTEAAMNKIKSNVNDMIDNGASFKNVTQALEAGITQPELLFESLAYIATLSLGFGVGAGARGLKLMKVAQKAHAMGDLKKAETTYKAAKSLMSKADEVGKVANVITKNSGLLISSGMMTNHQLDEVMQNNNSDTVSTLRKVTTVASNILINAFDRFTFGDIVKRFGGIKNVKNIISGMTKSGKIEFVKKAGMNGAKLLSSMGEEFATEAVQTGLEEFNRKFSTNKYTDDVGEFVGSKRFKTEALTSGFAGASGAVQFAGIGATRGAIASVGSKVEGKVKDSAAGLAIKNVKVLKKTYDLNKNYDSIVKDTDNIAREWGAALIGRGVSNKSNLVNSENKIDVDKILEEGINRYSARTGLVGSEVSDLTRAVALEEMITAAVGSIGSTKNANADIAMLKDTLKKIGANKKYGHLLNKEETAIMVLNKALDLKAEDINKGNIEAPTKEQAAEYINGNVGTILGSLGMDKGEEKAKLDKYQKKAIELLTDYNLRGKDKSKNMEEVGLEVSEIGFLRTNSSNPNAERRSLREHKKAVIDGIVKGNPSGSAMKSFNVFINSRMKKLAKKVDNNGYTTHSDGFLANTRKEDISMQNILSEIRAKIVGTKYESEYAKEIDAMHDKLQKTIDISSKMSESTSEEYEALRAEAETYVQFTNSEKRAKSSSKKQYDSKPKFKKNAKSKIKTKVPNRANSFKKGEGAKQNVSIKGGQGKDTIVRTDLFGRGNNGKTYDYTREYRFIRKGKFLNKIEYENKTGPSVGKTATIELDEAKYKTNAKSVIRIAKDLLITPSAIELKDGKQTEYFRISNDVYKYSGSNGAVKKVGFFDKAKKYNGVELEQDTIAVLINSDILVLFGDTREFKKAVESKKENKNESVSPKKKNIVEPTANESTTTEDGSIEFKGTAKEMTSQWLESQKDGEPEIKIEQKDSNEEISEKDSDASIDDINGMLSNEATSNVDDSVKEDIVAIKKELIKARKSIVKKPLNTLASFKKVKKEYSENVKEINSIADKVKNMIQDAMDDVRTAGVSDAERTALIKASELKISKIEDKNKALNRIINQIEKYSVDTLGARLWFAIDDDQKKIIKIVSKNEADRSIFDMYNNPLTNPNTRTEDLIEAMSPATQKNFAAKESTKDNLVLDKEKVAKMDTARQFIGAVINEAKIKDNIKSFMNNLDKKEGYSTGFNIDENGILVIDKNEKGFNPLALIAKLSEGSKFKNKLVFDKSVESTIMEVISYNTVKAYSEAYKAITTGDDDMIMSLYGVDPTNKQEGLEIAKRLQGEFIVPRAFIVNKTGKNIMQTLGIKIGDNVEPEVKDAIEKSFGLMAVGALAKSSMLIRIEDDDASSIGDDIRELYNETNGNTLFYRVNPLALGDGTSNINKKHQIRHGMKTLNDAVVMFAYLENDSSVSMPSLEPISKVDETIHGGKSILSERSRQNLKDLQSTPHTYSDQMDQTKDISHKLKMEMAGYIELDTLQASDRKRQQSINESIELNIDVIYNHYDLVGKAKMFFKWAKTASDRYMILGNIDKQNIKIHRHLIDGESDIQELVPNSPGHKDDIHMFKMALGQSLDIGIDKKTDYTAEKELNKMVYISEKGIVSFNENTNEGRTLKEIVSNVEKTGKFEDKTIKLIIGKDGLDLAGSEIYHTIQGINALVEMKKANGGKFKHNLTIESDAITSGMAITLLQIGSKKAMELLSKTGVYTTEMESYLKGLLENAYLDDKVTKASSVPFGHGVLNEAKYSKDWTEQKIDVSGNVENILHKKDSKVLDDLYSHVSTLAAKEMENIAENEMTDDAIVKTIDGLMKKGANLPTVAREKKKLKNGQSLLRFLMEAIPENGKIVRKLAKPLVMVYIYGASIFSINKAMTGSIAIDSMTKLMNSEELKNMTWEQFTNGGYTGKDQKIIEMIKFFGEVMYKENRDGSKKMLQPKFQYYDKENQSIEYALSDNPEDKARKTMGNLVFTKEMFEAVDKAMSPIYHKAFNNAFKEEFKDVSKYRNVVKTLAAATYISSMKHYDKAIEAKQKSTGRKKLTVKDINEVLADLEKKGVSHGINNINGENQSLHKVDKTQGDMIVGVETLSGADASELGSLLAMDIVKSNKRYNSVRAEVKQEIMNLRAAPTISIHSIDGDTLIDAVRRHFALGVFDAALIGSKSKNVSETSETYNQDFINKAQEHSVVSSMVEKLNKMLSGMGKEEMKAMFSKYITLGSKEAFMNSMAEDIAKLSNENEDLKLNVREHINTIYGDRKKNIYGKMAIGHTYSADGIKSRKDAIGLVRSKQDRKKGKVYEGKKTNPNLNIFLDIIKEKSKEYSEKIAKKKDENQKPKNSKPKSATIQSGNKMSKDVNQLRTKLIGEVSKFNNKKDILLKINELIKCKGK